LQKPDFFSDAQWQLAQGLPLGAHVDADGVIFIAFSSVATAIDLLLFDSDHAASLPLTPTRTIAMAKSDGDSSGRFYALVGTAEGGATEGLVYGFRVNGPKNKQQGHCCDPERVLLDPGANEIIHLGLPEQRAALESNNPLARVAAKLSVVTPTVVRRKRNRAEMVIYEVHVKGFTKQLSAVAPALRGTYAGFASEAAIEHLKQLGINTVCLLPIQAHLTEQAVFARQMTNYWGYNTIGFNFPDPRYACNPQDPTAVRQEFADMVQRLHENDIDVVLDVVYNHTAEAGIDGPTFSFRGFDNVAWYRGAVPAAGDTSSEAAQWRDFNDSGCGNTLNLSHPEVRKFVLDSLRYWVDHFGIDGFRFDLAPTLARNPMQFDCQAPFFRDLLADPLLSQVHLIAEPWDAGPAGYQLSEFPAPFLEWNDRYRDSMRRYWMGGSVTRSEFAQRLAGSSDIFAENGRGPIASINFVAVHDGFSLLDACTYIQKNNIANGEQNRDGRDGELCRAFAGEQRWAAVRALLATFLLSQGTPMLAAGDEFGRTQGGNNNAYCQDNEVTWLDWEQANASLLALTQFVLRLRREFVLLRHPRWFATQRGTVQDPALLWRNPNGQGLSANDWHDNAMQALAVVFDGGDQRIRFMLLVNPAAKAQTFVLTQEPSLHRHWHLCLDTANQIMHWPLDAFEEPNQIITTNLICSPQSLMLLYQHESL
jgi:isoamylase